MHMNIIDSINYGYTHLEPIIVGLMAMNKNFLLIGRHGAGKSRLAKILSQGYGEKSYVFYDATKDDLISIAGIPNAQAMQEGHLSFIPHQRAIWGKSTIVVDEITRASRENQNLWLEIMEERTCFGLPLSYRCLIATANPESYAAAFKLDEALLDRFHAVIPIPDLQNEMDTVELEKILKLSMAPKPEIEPETLARIFSEIQKAHAALIQDKGLEKVNRYCAQLVAELLKAEVLKKDDEKTYISPRTYARNFPESIMAVAAYYVVAGETEPLQAAAAECIKYVLGSKLKLNDGYLQQLHQSAKALLSEGTISEAEQLRYAMSALRSFEDRLSYLQDNRDKIKTHLKADELEKFLGTMLQGASKAGEKEKLVHLRNELEILGYQGDILRQVDGNLILTLNSAISTFIPILNKLNLKPNGKNANAWQQAEIFKRLVEQGGLISAKSVDALKLKAFLIDIYEEDVDPVRELVLEFFSNLKLE